MNIIFVVNLGFYKKRANLPTVGGIEVNTKDVIRELRHRGHNIWIPDWEPIEPEWSKKGEVDIISAPTFDPLTYLKVNKFKKGLKKRPQWLCTLIQLWRIFKEILCLTSRFLIV